MSTSIIFIDSKKDALKKMGQQPIRIKLANIYVIMRT